ncbi:hypothetical protein LRAMOSA09887 [Lichtheimia ramosa]|uniref:Uncharacterized protein n=1 Tax=Lichtheimia ramosa TaxID=688394 RepID=A0A077WLH3_9FUNG|nr:hypothetical protein LRAMOSA09887 [Lichtheimia ramosa]
MTQGVRPSPFPRRSVSSVAPFTVKRKQVNYEGLEMSSSQCSLASLLHKNDPSPATPRTNPESLMRNIIESKSVAESNAKIQQLEVDLKQATSEQKKWQHKYKLMENERKEFEASVKAQCERDKELLRTELKTVKDAHVDKVQELSSCIARLQRKVAALQDLMKDHNITQEPCTDDEAIDTILVNRQCKDDAEFIKNAYNDVRSSNYGVNRDQWTNIQAMTYALRHEVDLFQAWRAAASVPVEELARLMREEDKSSAHHSGVSAIRKTLFGRKGSGKRK